MLTDQQPKKYFSNKEKKTRSLTQLNVAYDMHTYVYMCISHYQLCVIGEPHIAIYQQT